MMQALISLLWLAANPAQGAATTPAAPRPAAGAPAPSATPATAPARPAAPAAAAQPVEKVAPADADQRMDRGLERLNAKKRKSSAPQRTSVDQGMVGVVGDLVSAMLPEANPDLEDGAAVLYNLYADLPETDLRRDTAAFHLAGALVDMGFVQAGVEYYLEVLSGRRSPELLGKTLTALKPLYEKGLVEEWRFLDGIIYTGQYADLEPEVADFIEYLQAMGDLRLGFAAWGRARLETLAATERLYGWRARYLLAVERIQQRNEEGAEKLLRQILESNAAPSDVHTVAALALARVLYERKQYDEAFTYYSQVRLPLVQQDLVLLERAWDRVGAEDHQRALGMVVGLGAPIFRRLFAPERELIRALALRKLCQYRLAHLVVREFHENYGALVHKARERAGLREDARIVEWASWGTRIAGFARMRTRLHTEIALIDRISDDGLEGHLRTLYGARMAFVEDNLRRGLPRAIERVVDELLRVAEQMDLIDYEISAGLVKPGVKRGAARFTARAGELPYGSPKVFFPFDGEYWSDELNDFAVLANDRCLR
jgi:tetratricopeptide (TPR) repeat protein